MSRSRACVATHHMAGMTDSRIARGGTRGGGDSRTGASRIGLPPSALIVGGELAAPPSRVPAPVRADGVTRVALSPGPPVRMAALRADPDPRPGLTDLAAVAPVEAGVAPPRRPAPRDVGRVAVLAAPVPGLAGGWVDAGHQRPARSPAAAWTSRACQHRGQSVPVRAERHVMRNRPPPSGLDLLADGDPVRRRLGRRPRRSVLGVIRRASVVRATPARAAGGRRSDGGRPDGR